MQTAISVQLWNESADALLTISPEGKILDWNKSAEDVFASGHKLR